MNRTESLALERDSGIASRKVLSQTYRLLAITLGFSGLVAYVAQQMKAPAPGLIITLVGFYGLMFLIHKFKNSAMSLVFTFMLTGFMGYTIGPMLSSVLAIQGGASLVVNAALLTAFVFAGLSAYVLMTGKDMSFLSGFLVAGFFVLLGGMALSFFVDISGLSLAISMGFVLFSSAAILYETSEIVRGGQDNYVLATVGLFVSIYNLFLSLINLGRALTGDD